MTQVAEVGVADDAVSVANGAFNTCYDDPAEAERIADLINGDG